MSNFAKGRRGGPEPFELFALRYANHSGRRAVDNMIGADPHDAGSDLDYFVWVARRSDRTFVIDVGFDGDQAKFRGRDLIRRPHEALKLIGIEADRVDEVILTHLHYDHAGTLGDFPQARFHVQDAEVAYATGRCMCHGFLRHPFHVEDVVSFVRCVYAGRVEFHDGTVELADGLTLRRESSLLGHLAERLRVGPDMARFLGSFARWVRTETELPWQFIVWMRIMTPKLNKV